MDLELKNRKVIFISNLQGNLYEKLLIEGLLLNDFEVESITSKSFIFLPKIFQMGKFEILHLHDVVHVFLAADSSLKRWIKFFVFSIQLLVVRLQGIKIIWTVHEWADKTGGKWGEMHPFWLKILNRQLNGIISHSQSTMDMAVKELNFKKSESTAVIMHGNYIGAYQNSLSPLDARKKIDIPQGSFVFLLFGNILRSKGFLEALSAFKEISQDNSFLLIVGFPGEEGIEEMISTQVAGLKNIVFLPQKIPDDDIQIYMNACDCVVLPYKVFTTSGVAILAMSFAKACLVPKIGYFAEILDDQGAFFYDPNDALGLQKAMESALDCKKTTLEMGQNNYEIAKQWNWEYVADETAKLYLNA